LPNGRRSGSRSVTRRGFGSEAWRRRPDNPAFEALTRVRAGHGGSRVGRSICLCPREARSPGNGPPSRTAAAGRPGRSRGFARAPAVGRARGAPPCRRGGPQPRRGAGERARARTAAASPTRPRSSAQPRPPHTPSRHQQNDRAPTDARPACRRPPLLPAPPPPLLPAPPPPLLPAPPPPLLPAPPRPFTHPLLQHTPTHASHAAPAPLPPPRPSQVPGRGVGTRAHVRR
jgi:hypothetical protein